MTTTDDDMPERIWLQADGTWRDRQITQYDCQYVRADFSAEQVERLRKALTGMVENFSEFPCDDTERWREEHQAYENALAALGDKS